MWANNPKTTNLVYAFSKYPFQQGSAECSIPRNQVGADAEGSDAAKA